MTDLSLPLPFLVSSPLPAESAFPAAALAGRKSVREMDELEQSRREDEELVAKAQAGGSTAFDALIVKHSPRLYALVYNMTANHDDTDDLLQDVWAKVYRSIGGFRGQSQFYTWVHSIAANTTINFLKKRGRRWTMSLDDLDSGILQDKEFTELQAASTPVRDADLGELQKKINEAIQQLTPDHRAVVTMFDIQGLPHAEIAKILRISEGTVRSRLFYAHKQLQAWLSEFAPVVSHSSPS
jgi:RNA polymerase sigma-70 factor (ECF subfamily)